MRSAARQFNRFILLGFTMTSLGVNGYFKIIGWAALLFALTVLTANPLSAQTYTVIHNFTGGPAGQTPYAGVVVDHAGNLYGTTYAGGGGICNGQLGFGCGIVFELNPSNGLFTTLWQFTGGDGGGPTTVLLGPGSTLYVSAMSEGGVGTIVSLSPPVTPPRSIQENHWIETISIGSRDTPVTELSHPAIWRWTTLAIFTGQLVRVVVKMLARYLN